MFTGLIREIGTISFAEKRGDTRIAIACKMKPRVGDSIAVNGACLTVTKILKTGFTAELSAETIACTAGEWKKGNAVNLEPSLKMGDALGGHLVSGHVDGIATVEEIKKSGGSRILELEALKSLMRFIAPKGSVTLDGTSLTVNKVAGNRFWVNIIPHTLRTTTLGKKIKGDQMNLEIDLLARYAEKLLKK